MTENKEPSDHSQIQKDSHSFIHNIDRSALWTIIGVVLLLITSYYAYRPLDKIPVKGTILIWVVIYYFFVALIEEVFNRGLLLNTLLKGFERNKDGSLKPQKVIDHALFEFRIYLEKVFGYDENKWVSESETAT